MCLDDCGGISRRTFVGAAFAAPLATRSGPLPGRRGLVRRTFHFARADSLVDGYVTYPPASRNSPFVTVMHGNAGLPADVKETVDWLGSLGFVAVAVNPTSREPDPSTIPRSLLRGRAFGDRYIEDTRAGIGQLKREGIGRTGNRVAVVGYCGGGYCGLLWNDTAYKSELGPLVGIHVGLRNYNADGTISDERPQGLDLYRLTEAPAQFHYGTADRLTPETDISSLRAIASSGRKTLEAYAYQGADHGFAMSTDETYRPDHTAVVRERAAKFLRRYWT